GALTAAERLLVEPLKQLGVELTYLANDIGSLGRDRLGKNFVTLSCVDPNDPAQLKTALDATLRLYADKVAAFRLLESQLPARAPLADYADLVAQISDGNLQATSLLSRQSTALRYAPWLRDALDSLPLLRRRER
ncbi:MAG TPA: hypothetical protein VEQ58_02460, partial [Polyangiaceae bacterium]|nr:hypothetical protein [Polyangiaceae bacterium]